MYIYFFNGIISNSNHYLYYFTGNKIIGGKKMKNTFIIWNNTFSLVQQSSIRDIIKYNSLFEYLINYFYNYFIYYIRIIIFIHQICNYLPLLFWMKIHKNGP